MKANDLLKLSRTKQAHIVDLVAMYGDGESRARRDYDLSAEELVEFMLEKNYERCKACRWFKPCGEFLDENDDLKNCDECQPLQ
jgi:hypothetical protein